MVFIASSDARRGHRCMEESRTQSSTSSVLSLLSSDTDMQTDGVGQQVQNLLNEIEDELFSEDLSSCASSVAPELSYSALRDVNAEVTSAAEILEWSRAFPHIRVCGSGLSSSTSETARPGYISERSETDDNEQQMSTINHVFISSNPSALQIQGQRMTQKKLDDSGEEELICSQGSMSEVIAFDSNSVPTSSLEHIQGITDITRVRHCNHREQLGFLPLTPQRLFYHNVLEELFGITWSHLSAVLEPQLLSLCAEALKSAQHGGPSSPGHCQLRRLDSVMIIRPYSVLALRPQKQSIVWSPTAASKATRRHRVQTRKLQQVLRPSTCMESKTQLLPSLQVLSYEHLYRAEFQHNRSKSRMARPERSISRPLHSPLLRPPAGFINNGSTKPLLEYRKPSMVVLPPIKGSQRLH